MKVHIQLIAGHQNRVFVRGREIFKETSLLLRNHSPDGFHWGYHGSGPAQTALGICIELFGAHLADRVYQQFKSAFVAEWKQEGEYNLDLTEFFADVVMSQVPDAITKWAVQLAWHLAEKSAGVLDCDVVRVDPNTLTAFLQLPHNDEAFGLAKQVADDLGLISLRNDGNGWQIEAKYPLTDAMIGLLTDYAINRATEALGHFNTRMETLKEEAEKIFAEGL